MWREGWAVSQEGTVALMRVTAGEAQNTGRVHSASFPRQCQEGPWAQCLETHRAFLLSGAGKCVLLLALLTRFPKSPSKMTTRCFSFCAPETHQSLYNASVWGDTLSRSLVCVVLSSVSLTVGLFLGCYMSLAWCWAEYLRGNLSLFRGILHRTWVEWHTVHLKAIHACTLFNLAQALHKIILSVYTPDPFHLSRREDPFQV